MDLAFPIAAFLTVLAATNRSLGLGFVALFAVGYVNGVIRANFLSVFTTFMFDMGVLGLYVGFLAGASRRLTGLLTGGVGQFVLVLIAWPVLMTAVPVNDFLVQLVALRATVWFLPVALIATRLSARDLQVIARGLAGLNLVALAGGLYVYANGVEALYPDNAVTQIIYRSSDVGNNEFHRVPSFFLSSSAYGGTMLLTLPFILNLLFQPGTRLADRGLAAAGLVAALGGILLCAARQPLVVFAVATLTAWAVSRFSPWVGLVAAGVVAAGAAVASTDVRLQRTVTLQDAEVVTERVQGSASENFVELFFDYPAGAGMGSSFGTSIPFFLADRAPKPIGLENEYCRIMIDQGWVGLGGWLAFLGWLYARPPRSGLGRPWQLGVVLMFSLSVTVWLTAFIGAGTLSSVPGTVLLLVQMGVVAAARGRGGLFAPPPRPAVRPRAFA